MKITHRIFALTMLILLLFSPRIGYLQSLPDKQYSDSFNEICKIVENNFYDPKIIREKFPPIRQEASAKLKYVRNDGEFSTLINSMLAGLKTSHTHYYTRNDPEYYQLASVFQQLPLITKLFNYKEIRYSTIGIITHKIDGKTFVAGVLEGGAGEKAGLLKGDEIVSVNGRKFEPSIILNNKPGSPIELKIRRQKDKEPFKLSIIPEIINPHKEFKRAVERSIKIIRVGDKKIGYIHMWSYAGNDFHRIFEDAVETEALGSADALIWDLRDGWGGAGAQYLSIFSKNIPSCTTTLRNGERYTIDTQWRKPVVMLTNNRTRSGKEILAYGFKRYKIGTIIGEKTEGAVTAGKLFITKDRNLLYLAIIGVEVDGTTLEGRGVEPDSEVPMDIRYTGGKDVQVEKALEFLEQLK